MAENTKESKESKDGKENNNEPEENKGATAAKEDELKSVTRVNRRKKTTFSEAQMKMAQQRMHASASNKSAVSKAKEEEKNYVEFRKQEILFAYRPKTAGALRPADESFPRRRRGISMGFGERKAYYLSLRPNPKYATWFGKKRTAGTFKKLVSAKAGEEDSGSSRSGGMRIMAPCAPVPISKYDDVKTSQYRVQMSTGGKSGLQKGVDDDEDSDKELKKEEKKGNNSNKALVKGVPFWTIGQEGEEEITDDDLPIDMEVIDKVCNGEKKLQPRPHDKLKFDPWDFVENYKRDDDLFERETSLFANTVETVLNLFPEKDNKPADRGELPKKVKWSKIITATSFDKANREPKKERKPVEEPMKDIKREVQT